MNGQQRRMRRDLVDLALGQCETAIVAGDGCPSPWVLALVVELQAEQGRPVVPPADSATALAALLDLQAAYLHPEPGPAPASAALAAPSRADLELAVCGGRAA